MLEKIVVILSREPEGAKTEGFRRMLKEEGIENVWFAKRGKEEPPGEEGGIFSGTADFALPEGKTSGIIGRSSILVISDSAGICCKAVNAGYAVIAYLEGKEDWEEQSREEEEAIDRAFRGVRYAAESFEGMDRRYLERICRRYAGLPWEILRTERCIVRETTVADVDDFYRIYAETGITEYMEGLFEKREEEIKYIEDYIKTIYEFYEYGIWTVLDKESGRVIGRAGISWRADAGAVEIGFVIAVPYQRQGYGFEVCDAVLRYAREELEMGQIAAFVKAGNRASKALCQKLGFVYRRVVCLKNGFGGEESFEQWVYDL